MTPIVKMAPSTASNPTTVKFSNKQDVITNYTNEQQIKNQINIEKPQPMPSQKEIEQPQQQTRFRKSGWMFKLNQTGFKLWKKRYFVLNESILNYYPGILYN
jgi:hypothetical protein